MMTARPSARLALAAMLAAATMAFGAAECRAAGGDADILAAARRAAQSGNRDEVVRLGQEIAAIRAALPAWAEQKREAASAVPEAHRGALPMWNRYHGKAVEAMAAGDVDKALSLAGQALTIARDNFGERHFATVISATDLARILAAAGRPTEAEDMLRQAETAAAEALGPGHPETLKVQGALADLFTNQARYPQAAEQRAAMARAAAAALGPLHAMTLAAGAAHAQELERAGRLRDAEAVLAPVCAGRAKGYGEFHAETALCLAQQAGLARQTGDIARAATEVERALAVLKLAAPDGDAAGFAIRGEAAAIRLRQGRAEEAQSLLEALVKDCEAAGDAAQALSAKSDLVTVLDERGDYAAAEALAKAILDQQVATLGDAHPNTLATLTSLASLQRKMGRLAEAEATFARVHDRFAKVLGQDHRSTIIAANNLGEVLEKEGLYDRAEPYLVSAVEGSRKAYGETDPTTLVGMNNLALLYESQGSFDKAEALYKGVIAVFTKRHGPNHPETVALVNNLAYLYLLKEEFDKAVPLFRQVVSAWTASYGPRHQNTLKAENSLARVYHRLGRLSEARAMFDRTLAARREVLGERHPDTLRSMHDLAALLRTAKRLDDAQVLLEKTLAGDEQVLGPLHPYTFETLNTLAAVKEDKGDLAGALEVRHTTFVRRNDFLNRMLYVAGENAREGYVRLHQPELAAYMALLARMDPDTAGRGMLEISLNRKGLLLKVASELAQIGRLSRDPELSGMTEELAQARKRLAALTLSGPTEETKGRHLEIVGELEDRIGRLQGNLGRASARFRKTVEQIKLDELVAAMPDDAVLVDYLQFTAGARQSLVAATLRKDGGKPVFGMVGLSDPATVDAAILKYRKDIQNEDIELDEMQDSGQSAYTMVWKPLESSVDGKAKVFVVPDGTLNILPFAALVDKGGKYLIERVDLHIYTTSRNLLPSHLPDAKGGYMINAGPDYNSDDVAGKETLEKARSRSRASSVQEGMRGLSSGMRGLRFSPLPGAEREGQLIRQTVEGKGKPAIIFSKADAQEKVLRDMQDPPEILHIATHGFFLKADDTLRNRLLKLQRGGDIQLPPPGDNPLLRSGLAFAGINANAQLLGEIDTDNDGVLTALEVLSLNLTGTRLAILSACETGLGEIHEGEGVYGLRRAFQEAGVGSVVSSLWEVSDAGTQTLMAALYGRLLTGVPPHKALRDAQLEMLRIGQWSSPYIWSAFFMVDG
jgi:CHAT domain-containing protein/tetratricopeptide (TPR) repeat protein